MPEFNIISIIGGDMRQVHLAKLLCKDGFTVKAYGFDKDIEPYGKVINLNDLDTALENSDLIILPLPFSQDGISINAPYSSKTIYVNDVYTRISPRQLVVGGRLNDKAFNEAGRHGFKIVDYFEREELAVLNAIPTAEGAIQIAMEELPITLHGSNCLITGFGRISKILAKMLHAIGARVTICARKYSDIAWIKAYGYHHTTFSELKNSLKEFDLIFNSVPNVVLGEEELTLIKNDALIIDLASKPGGIDLISAGKLGKKVIWALSLPGKVAPLTSGEIIKETIINILSEEVQ